MFEVLRYQAPDGSEPFTNWLRSVGDKRAEARIRLRIQRIATGNFGQHGKSVVVLLCGGTKRTQAADIQLARWYWADWKQRQP